MMNFVFKMMNSGVDTEGLTLYFSLSFGFEGGGTPVAICIEIDDFVLKLMNCVFKMMNFVSTIVI